MAVSRACSLGRGLALRGSVTRVANGVFLTGRYTAPSRSIPSTFRQFREVSSASSISTTAQSSVPEGQRQKNARSVKLFKVRKHATPSEVESIFRDSGLKVADVHMNIDRFRFQGDGYASVELANEQQAKEAVQKLHGKTANGQEVILRPLNPEFAWDSFKPKPYFVRHSPAGIKEAVQPIIDGRRARISVRSPAWGKAGDAPGKREVEDREVLQRTFGRFGIEAISKIVPQYGHKTYDPKFFCHIDFATKQGAEDAIQAVHEKEVEGVLVWARPSEVDATKAFQIGRFDKESLAELQEKDLAPPDSEIHEDWVSKSAKEDPKQFDRHRSWQDKTRPPHKRTYRQVSA